MRRQRTLQHYAQCLGGLPAAKGTRPPRVHHLRRRTEAEPRSVLRRIQMPELLQPVITRRTADRVQNDHRGGLQKGNTAPVGKSRVSASRVQVIPIPPRGPLANTDRGLIVPAKRTARNRLVSPIDAYRVVRARPSEPV